MDIDWRRIESALRQEARKQSVEPEAIEIAMSQLQALVNRIPTAEWSRAGCVRIGKILLHGRPTLMAPCCPDYSYDNGRYTFKSVGNGISLLAQHHIVFLQRVQEILPGLCVLLVLADHEVDDPVLCQAVRVSREEFLGRVHASVQATRAHVSTWGWRVCVMTEAITDLVAREQEIAAAIRGDPALQHRLLDETLKRREMYERIATAAGIRFSIDDMLERTIRTASQYVALGRFAAESRYIVVNHTTTNLNWYLHTDAAVIHNPVSVY